MLKSQLLISLFIIISLANCDKVSQCSKSLILKEECQKLSPENEGQSCYYDGSNCISVYTKCENYKGNDENECKAISSYLDDITHECIFEDGECKTKINYCDDYSSGGGKEYCEMLNTHTTSSRCIYNSDDDSCKEHHNECKDADSSFCSENIPSDIRLKCSYNEEKNECQSIKRKCNEYKSLSSYGIVDNCLALEASTEGKICILDLITCKEGYKQCEDYTSDTIDEDTCKNIKLYIKDTIEIDYSHKCVVEDNACVTRQRTCEEFDYSIESDIYYCKRIKFDDNPHLACYFDYYYTHNCYQIYTTCEGYTGNNSTICRNIIPLNNYDDYDYHLKCDIKNSKCVTLGRECKEFNTSVMSPYSICENLIPSDKTKQCFLTSDKRCVEIPKSRKCEDYEGISEEKCQKITLYYENNEKDDSHYCVYEGDSCVTKLKTCDYSRENCNKIILSETKRCLYFKGKCQEIYKKCEDYKGTDGDICAKIIPFKSMYEIDEGYECFMEKDKNCIKKKKEEAKYCNYQGNIREICEMQKPSDPDRKVCFFTGSKCIEQYKYCSDYKGIYEEECKSIIPYDPETNKIDPYSKCVFEPQESYSDNLCVKRRRTCNDYYGYDPSFCSTLYAQDENKNCVSKENYCREQYKTCETYIGDNKLTCEFTTLKDHTKKCVFQDSKCQTMTKTCSDFNTDFLGNICESRSLNDYKMKCSFDSYYNFCNRYTKTCNEITFSNENEASEEKCNAIETNNDICTLKMDKSGCILKSYLEEGKRIEEKQKQANAITDEDDNPKANTNTIKNIDSTIKYNNDIDSESVTDYKSDIITDNATNTNTNRNSGGKNLNIIFGLISISLLLL